MMLASRLFTALLLILVALGLLFWGAPPLLNILGILLFLTLGYEWGKLVPITSPPHIVGSGLLLLFALSFVYHYFTLCFTVSMIGWLYILYALTTFPQSKTAFTPPIVCLSALLMLSLAALSTSFIYQAGPAYLLDLLLIVWVTDTGAYFVGKACGRHKLIPQVSPGKTVEGTIGGIILACGLIVAGFFYFQPTAYFIYFLQGIVTIFMAIIGDLWISLLKRRAGCKDTGHWLPGHGGVLDRLDSYIAAAPVFYVLGNVLNVF